MADDMRTGSDRINKLEERLYWLERLVEEHVIGERIVPLEDHLERNGAILA